MKIIEDGKGMEYHQLDNGTCYGVLTPVGVVEILEKYRDCSTRIRVFYGDTATGRDWMEENNTMGIVGRSSGKIKIPLLIKTKRSFGGEAVLDSAIVQIQIGHFVAYKHPNYHQPAMRIVDSHVSGYAAGVDFDNVRHANFKTWVQAGRYIAFMEGRRNSK